MLRSVRAGFRRRFGCRDSVRAADAVPGRLRLGPAGPRRGLEVVMTTLFRRLGKPVAGRATATLTLGLVAAALLSSSSASAQTRPCSDDVMSAPTGPATVSAASTTSYGSVLVVGSGDYAGCSLYLLTSDQLHALSGAGFACSDNINVLNMPCDSDLWPALLTEGDPIAGPGVNPRLLGTVTRTDLPGLSPVQQVTYAGQPLYRFFLDQAAGDTQGANLDDPVTSPAGHLVPGRSGSGHSGDGPGSIAARDCCGRRHRARRDRTGRYR